MASGSAMIRATVMRGSSEANGSWKTICMSRRRRLSVVASSARMFSPSNVTRPAVGSMSLRRRRARVDLPHPDSPTMPSVSPFLSVRLTPSTARAMPLLPRAL